MKNLHQNTISMYLLPSNDRKPGYVLTFMITILMAVVSIAGLLNPTAIYPTQEQVQTFMANDVVNLLIGVPILLVSMRLTSRGKLVGLLLWPGALLYVVYNYTGYLVGVRYGVMTYGYLILGLTSAFSVYELVRSINKESVKERLEDAVPVNFPGWVLLLFGIIFISRAASIIVEVIQTGTRLSPSVLGVLVADIIVSTLWILGGVSLLREKPLGFVSALGLLFAASMLFIGLIVFLLLQPVLTDAPFLLTDVLVVFVMGLVCFVPFGLYFRGVILTQASG